MRSSTWTVKRSCVINVVLVLVHADIGDVGIGFADFGRDTRQHAFFVLDQQPDAAVEAAVQIRCPTCTSIQRSGSLHALALGDVAVGGMHDQALVASQLADDAVARNRQAARRQLHRDAFAAVDR